MEMADKNVMAGIRFSWWIRRFLMANLRANKIVGIGSTDAGVTFNGPISLNTQGYMYFPTGKTTDRGRGRAIFAGGG